MPKQLKEGPNMPGWCHSSEAWPEVWGRAKKAKQLVILGAGKAGCDILNFGCDPSWPNVTWVHRGMHIFINRKITSTAAQFDEGHSLTVAMAGLQEAARTDRSKTWEVHGLERTITFGGETMPLMLKAKGELTGRPHKSGSGITYEHEINALNGYKQLRMEKMESADDGTLVITSAPKADGTSDTLRLGADDFIVFATGQANEGIWPEPRYERGLAVAHQISPTGPLNAIPMVGLALDHLRGTDTSKIDALSERAAAYRKYKSIDAIAKTYKAKGQTLDNRGLDGQMMTFMKEINMDYMLTACRYNYNAPDGKTYTLPADVMYKRAWVEEWYGKELG
eukprot:6018310-Prymnesium_polylepis.1